MAWEWRYFLQTLLPEDGTLPLAGKREDIYFPASETMGLKLRNGNGGLEVKLRTRVSDADGRLPGPAEFWEKDIHSGCLTKSGDGNDHVELDAEACAQLVGRAREDIFAIGAGHTIPIQVLCRKNRRHSRLGEEVDCLFVAMLKGHSTPLLAERFQSICVESPDLNYVAKAVKQMGSLPSDAIVGGYPKIVQRIAQKAMEVASRNNCLASAVETKASLETSDNSPRQCYKVLQIGDVREAPNRDAPVVGQLQEGCILQSIREHTAADGVQWVLLPSGWAATTKKNGTLKLAVVVDESNDP